MTEGAADAAGESPRADPPSRGPQLPAWLVFLVAVTAEYLAVSTTIDAKDLLAPAGLEAGLGEIGSVAPLGFAVVAALLVTGGRSARRALERLGGYRGAALPTAAWVAVHGVLLATSFFLLRRLTAGEMAVVTLRAGVALWLAIVLATLTALALALWSPRALRDAFVDARTSLGVGFAVGAIAWIAGLLSRALWRPLAQLTLELVHALLTLIASDPVAVPEEALVGTRRFYVEVAPICSGVEGIGLIAALMGAFLYLERRELVWPRALLLLPLSGLLVWLLNVVRITALIAVGTWGSPAVALGGFHSKAGWILFTVAALGTVLLARRLTVFRRKELRTAVGMPAPLVAQEPSDAASTETDELGAFTAAYLAPMLAVLGVSMLTGLVTTDGFDGLYPLRVLAAGVALWHFRRRYSSLAVSRPWLGLGAGILLGAAWIAVASQPTGAAPHPVAVALGALPSAAAAAWVGMRLFGSVVAVPVVEELAFRGFLMRRLVDRDFYRVRLDRLSWPALLLSSVGYGLLHAQWWQGIAAGLLYGLLVIARGRLTDAIVAHGATNAVLAAYVLVTGDWSLLG